MTRQQFEHSASVRREHSRRTRRVVTLAGAVALAAAALAGCGGNKTSNTNGDSRASGTSDAVAVADAEAGSTAAAADLLGTGIAGLGTTFHFVTTAEVGSDTVLTAQGDRVGSGSRLTLTTSTGVVSYVITADGSWAKPENGTWSKLDVAPANSDPLGALADATDVRQVASEGQRVQLVAVVANADLGITQDGNAEVTVILENGVVTSVSYTADVSGRSARVVTRFSAVVDGAEVVAPL